MQVQHTSDEFQLECDACIDDAQLIEEDALSDEIKAEELMQLQTASYFCHAF